MTPTGTSCELVLSPLIAVHLADAIRVHTAHLRESGSAAPAEYTSLGKFFASHGTAQRSLRVTAGHAVPIFDAEEQRPDPERMLDLLTYADVAAATQTSVRTVKRVVAAGRLATVRVGSRGVRIRRADLDDYLGATQ